MKDLRDGNGMYLADDPLLVVDMPGMKDLRDGNGMYLADDPFLVVDKP